MSDSQRISDKLRQAYHNDLTDVPLLLDAADEIDRLNAALGTFFRNAEAWETKCNAAWKERDAAERQRGELKAQVDRLLAKDAARLASIMTERGYAGGE